MSFSTPMDAEFSDSSGKESDYYSCEEYPDTSPTEGEAQIMEGAGSKRKASDCEPQVTNWQRNKRSKSKAFRVQAPCASTSTNLKAEPNHDPGCLCFDTQPDPNNTVPFSSKQEQQHDQTYFPQRKHCPAFRNGKKCKNGAGCRYEHDDELREEYLRERKIRRQRLRAINAQQWAEEEKELKSRQESADPEFAILVCGYGERYDGRKVAISKVLRRFRGFKPVTIRWSSQFSAEERETLEDQYSLPKNFFRMNFSTIADQRMAITKINGKKACFRGPRLLVQRYIAGRIEDGTMVPGGGTASESITSRAEEFHRKIQDEEMERNRNYRLGNAPEETRTLAKWMREKDEDTELKHHSNTLGYAPEDTNAAASWMRVKTEDAEMEVDHSYTLGYAPEETSTTEATNAVANWMREQGENAEMELYSNYTLDNAPGETNELVGSWMMVKDEDTEMDLQWHGYHESEAVGEEPHQGGEDMENEMRQFAKIDDSGLAVYD